MTNEQQIENILIRWADAVKARNMDGILVNHATGMIMFDVPPPFESVGIDSYRKTWEDSFFGGTEQGIFEIVDLKIEADENVAFCIAKMKCSWNNNGAYEDLHFRLTTGLKKINDQWIIVHEHHSIPATGM